MSDQETIVRSVYFSDDGVEIGFMQIPGDVRFGGRVVGSHVIAVSAESEFGQRIKEMQKDVEDFIETLLAAWATSEPIDPRVQDPDDDDDDD